MISNIFRIKTHTNMMPFTFYIVASETLEPKSLNWHVLTSIDKNKCSSFEVSCNHMNIYNNILKASTCLLRLHYTIFLNIFINIENACVS